MIDRVAQALESIELDILSDIDDAEIFQFIIESLRYETDSPYAVLTQATLHYNLKEEEASQVWESILINKKEMERLLGRRVSIKTALVDFYTRKRQSEKIAIFIRENMITAFDRALRDSLTGLYSHAIIQSELEKEFLSARRYSFDLSVLFIDIDDFKRYNDTHGHITGDRILMAVSEALKNSLRNTDKIGRYGGEEFLIILPHTGIKNAVTIAEKLLTAIRNATTGVKDLPGGITVSIGAAGMTPETNDGHDLINRADILMYQAKNEGKNRVCCDHKS